MTVRGSIVAVACALLVGVSGFYAGRLARRGRELPPHGTGDPNAVARADEAIPAPPSTEYVPETGAVESSVRDEATGPSRFERRRPPQLPAEHWSEIEKLLEEDIPESGRERRRFLQGPVFAKARERLRGKFPTNEPDGRGEMTHPAVVARLIDACLDAAGLPLDDEQWRAAEELVAEYDEAFAVVRDQYDRNTPRFEKVVDEVGLKQEFLAALSETLREAQRTELEARSPPGERLPTLFSPILMVDLATTRIHADQRSEMRESFARDLAGDFGVARESVQMFIDRFWVDIAPNLGPERSGLAAVDQALIAGRAQVELFRSLLEAGDLDERARRKAIEGVRWVVIVGAD